METKTETNMQLIDLLPAIYQDPGQNSGEEPNPGYLLQFLHAFEEILWGLPRSGRSDELPERTSLRGRILGLEDLLDPWRAQGEFLPWLAGWAALTLRPGMQLERKRKLIAGILSLYRIRGTKDYLEQMLSLCVETPVAVDEEELPPFQIGKHSTLGKDCYLGGGPPHFFRVRMLESGLSVQQLEEYRQLVYEVVELAKPAHTGYALEMDSPQMQIGVHSKVGLDTVLGPATAI
jgi:phage tail-like protein